VRFDVEEEAPANDQSSSDARSKSQSVDYVEEGSYGSEGVGIENSMDLIQLKKDLESYRDHEMSPFIKVNNFFITYVNDAAFYYVNGKRSYELEDAFETTATRDFIESQI
jgi:hypothetical protein